VNTPEPIREPSLVDFWLGYAFGSISIAGFLAAAWSKDFLQWLVP
jgi:hypothetical protein